MLTIEEIFYYCTDCGKHYAQEGRVRLSTYVLICKECEEEIVLKEKTK